MMLSINQNYTWINCSLKDMSLFPQSAMKYLIESVIYKHTTVDA